ncbi:PRC-barrel domain-containing protein [Legionella dresdenensis]|uniref:PRC-barrel domain-containing protein n=1 Tax=Legionella dresdenensis TaxID=450200 RepID=A0ABV8CGU8_9GAMM
MENHTIVKASEVTGVKVTNPAGEDLGEINEVVLDKMSGKVNYLVLDFGGILGFGNKFFAVPWQSLSYNPTDNCYILNGVTEERLKNAPGFNKENWPDFADRTVTDSITRFYQIN